MNVYFSFHWCSDEPVIFTRFLTILWLPNLFEEDSRVSYNKLPYEAPGHGNVSWNLNTSCVYQGVNSSLVQMKNSEKVLQMSTNNTTTKLDFYASSL